MTTMTLHINHSTDDEVLGATGVDWIEVDDDLDSFIFSWNKLKPSITKGTPLSSQNIFLYFISCSDNSIP